MTNTEREQRVRAAIQLLIDEVEFDAQHGGGLQGNDTVVAINKLVAIAMEPAADEAGLLRRCNPWRDYARHLEWCGECGLGPLCGEGDALRDVAEAAGQAPKESNNGRV